MRLEIADCDVAAVLGLGLRLLQHPVGLADAGGHAEEDFVPPRGRRGSVAGISAGARSGIVKREDRVEHDGVQRPRWPG